MMVTGSVAKQQKVCVLWYNQRQSVLLKVDGGQQVVVKTNLMNLFMPDNLKQISLVKHIRRQGREEGREKDDEKERYAKNEFVLGAAADPGRWKLKELNKAEKGE